MQADNHGYKYKCYIALNNESDHIQFFDPIENSKGYAMSSWGCIQFFANLCTQETEKLFPLTEIADEYLLKLDYSDEASSRLNECISLIIQDEFAGFLTQILTDTCFTFATDAMEAKDRFRSHTEASDNADLHLLTVCSFSKELLEKLSSGCSFDDIQKQFKAFFDFGFINFCRYYPYVDYSSNSFSCIDLVIPTNIYTLIGLCLIDIQRQNLIVKKCKNCGEFFSPSNRSDEIYCDSCKNVSYDEKIKSDSILKEYRKIYKTQNARKQRNSHISNISKRFQAWACYAKAKLYDCQCGTISLDEMVSAISSDEWIYKEASHGEHSED